MKLTYWHPNIITAPLSPLFALALCGPLVCLLWLWLSSMLSSHLKSPLQVSLCPCVGDLYPLHMPCHSFHTDQCYTNDIPMIYQCYNNATPMLHQCYTNATPMLYQCYINDIPMLYIYYSRGSTPEIDLLSCHSFGIIFLFECLK